MPFFITLEGIEGSGKSTQIRHLRDFLTARGVPVLLTREPGGCPIADSIRAILLNPANLAMTARTELLLYAAARAQHVEQVIRPALAAGTTVLCDRFIDATTAYQGGGRGLDGELIAHLNAVSTAGLAPDLTLLFDFAAEQGLERARRRNQQGNLLDEGRFELEDLDFHRRVRQSYLQLASREGRFRIIDAGGSADEVAARMTVAVDHFIAQREPL
jgi:dTMP kinase